MNRNIIIIFFLSIAMFACQNVKQNSNKSQPENNETNRPINRVGGWSEAEINDEVKNIALFALEEIQATSEIDEILNVKTQIVSGKNYDITFTLKNGEKWNVIVYKNLNHELKLIKSSDK